MNQYKIGNVALVGLAVFSLIGLSNPTHAANGQLVLINSLGVVVNGSLGGSASNISVQVSDATGVCTTVPSLAYGGVMTTTWNSANVHSATKCTDITSVAVTALKTASGIVQFDSTANATPPAIATAPTVFTAPTTPIANVVLIITGNGSPMMTNSATSWGAAAGVAPVYLVSNGSISVTGIMGGVGSIGLKANSEMLKYGIIPVQTNTSFKDENSW